MIYQDNTPPFKQQEHLAEMMELIRMMLADSPFPIQFEDYPEAMRRRSSAA